LSSLIFLIELDLFRPFPLFGIMLQIMMIGVTLHGVVGRSMSSGLTRGWNPARVRNAPKQNYRVSLLISVRSAKILGRGRPTADAAQKDLPQDDCIVMRFVMGCKDERYPARPGACAQFVELFRVLVNLIRVSLSKRLPARGIMSKPLAQVGTGRDVFQPMVDGGVLLAKASGPQAVNQDPRAVASRRRVIGSLHFDIFSRKPRHCLFARM